MAVPPRRGQRAAAEGGAARAHRSESLKDIVRLVAAIVMVVALATGIDPYLSFSAPPGVQLLNAAPALGILLCAWAITGRAWLALVAPAILLALLRVSDGLKVRYLDSNLVYADFQVLGSLVHDPQLVLGFVKLQYLAWPLALVAGLVAAWWMLRRRQPSSAALRWTCAVLAGVLLACATLIQLPPRVPSMGWEVFTQNNGARKVGVSGNLVLGRLASGRVEPVREPGLAEAFWKDPLVQQAEAELQAALHAVPAGQPDIIVIQSESLFDPGTLCEVPRPALLEAFAEYGEGGGLDVPVFGGRTLQTEFEVLTGAPISAYPRSMFAYYELLDHPVEALPRAMGRLGYRTVAIHPNNRGFWRRGAAMERLGFSTFLDIGSFRHPNDFSRRGFVSDAALTRAVLSVLDSSPDPAFITAITMDNHGPWGGGPVPNPEALPLPEGLDGEARTILADYMARAIDADRAYAYLVKALERRGRPAVVLVYGDHLPALPEVYERLCFRDGQRPQAQRPPFRIWANFEMPPVPQHTRSYLLPGLLLRSAGVPLDETMRASVLAAMVDARGDLPQEARERVLRAYAQVAVERMEKPARNPGPVRAVVAKPSEAVRVLARHLQPDSRVERLERGFGFDGDGEAVFRLGGRVERAVLRMRLDDVVGCPREQAPRMEVFGDDTLLYSAWLSPATFRLVNLELGGVEQLRMQVRGPRQDCGRIVVRTAQLQCVTAGCKDPQDVPAHARARPQMRALEVDPAEDDIRALSLLRTEFRRSRDEKVANLDFLLARVLEKDQAYGSFRRTGDGQLFMHPDEARPARLVLDVAELDALELTPRIEPLNDECLGFNEPGKEGGVVGLEVLLDGRPMLPRTLIDRDHAASLPLQVAGGKRLELSVDKGNEVPWCDWFSVGARAISTLDQGHASGG